MRVPQLREDIASLAVFLQVFLQLDEKRFPFIGPLERGWHVAGVDLLQHLAYDFGAHRLPAQRPERMATVYRPVAEALREPKGIKDVFLTKQVLIEIVKHARSDDEGEGDEEVDIPQSRQALKRLVQVPKQLIH